MCNQGNPRISLWFPKLVTYISCSICNLSINRSISAFRVMLPNQFKVPLTFHTLIGTVVGTSGILLCFALKLPELKKIPKIVIGK